ncbi:MAG: hypothetical protein Q9207_006417 [Kuettlingeria erythrocarpa]
MGWLWTSKATPSSSELPFLSKEIPTDSAPAVRDVDPTVNPASPQHADPDAELQALLSSLDTIPKPTVASTKPTHEPTTPEESTLTSSSHYPTEMSCRSAFDSAFYCQSLGGQFNNVYRYGNLRDCSGQWSQFWFCMKTNKGFLGDQERESRIQNHYRLREKKYQIAQRSRLSRSPRPVILMETFCLHNTSSLPPLSLAPCPPFPFRPLHWEPKTPISICGFLNYTRQLKVVLIRNPDYFLKNRFELEAYILLLHTCYPEEEGKYVWFSMARQVLGRPLVTYESGELREEQRTWAIVRVQSACRDLIWPDRWEEEDTRVKAASIHMQKVIRKAMLAYVRNEQNGIPDFIPGEELRKCERWVQKVVIPHVQSMLNGEIDDDATQDNSSDNIPSDAMVDAPDQAWLLSMRFTPPADEDSF